MISAVEARENKWDFSCANDYELFKALEIDCDKLDVKFIDFSKRSFGAVSRNIATVTNALSKRGIMLRFGQLEEAGNNRKAPLAYSEVESFFEVRRYFQTIVVR
jgi:hypothetical protein